MTQARFADTFYFIALLFKRDAAHARAVHLSRTMPGPLVTTDAVLLELGDAFNSPRDRQVTAAHIASFWERPTIKVVPVNRPLLRRALALYAARKDKDWGLTDCVSFVVMREEGIHEALTGDTHFEQAGFRILFPQSD